MRIKKKTPKTLSAMQGRKNEIGRQVISLGIWLVDFACDCQSFHSAASTELFRKRWTGIRSMISPARVNKSLAYPRANADKPVVPDRRSGLSKPFKNLCVLI
jgi:hypothetical protein